MNASPDHDWARKVHEFWFAECGPDDWFKKSDALDAEIQERFGTLHTQLSQKTAGEFLNSPEETFAAIILFDQLSRNLFRGNPRSFATDPLALDIARGMIARGWDKDVAADRRVFVYLPFEHSEDLEDQDTCVELIGALGDEQFTRYANAHRDVIERFGRFPHRNAVLGRTSTRAEEEYLSTPGSGF
jgi:uncharacterized protein (DUF924 family)